MKDNPWFKCYPGDFLGGVSDLSPAEGWVYTIVLMRMYDEDGAIPDDPKRIARRCNMRLPACKKVIDQLVDANKLIRSDGQLCNRKATEVIATRQKTGEKVIATRQKTGEKVIAMRQKTGEKVIAMRQKTGEKVTATRQKTGEKVIATRQKTGEKVIATAPQNEHEGAENVNENNEGDEKTDTESMDPLAGEARSQKLDNNPPVAMQQAPPGGRKRKRAARLPENWQPVETMIVYAEQKGLTQDETARLADDIRDWSRSSPNGAKLDWLATWQTWVRRRVDERGDGVGKQSGNGAQPSSALASLANNLDFERRRHGGAGDAMEPVRTAGAGGAASGSGGGFGGAGAGGNANSIQGTDEIALVDEGPRRRRGDDDAGGSGDGRSPSGMAGGRGDRQPAGDSAIIDVLPVTGGDCGNLPGTNTDAPQHSALSKAGNLGRNEVMEAPAFLRRAR